MKRFRSTLPLLLVLAAACARPPVRDELSIEFSGDDDSVVVTGERSFDLRPDTDAARHRADVARAEARAGSDPWSIRFGRLTPEADRVTYQNTRGTLEKVTRSARIASEDLQLLLADTNITVSVIRGEGWRELSLYAGSGARGTREQERRFSSELEIWSRSVAKYFAAIDRLYSYLNGEPGRAKVVFATLIGEKGPDGAEPLVREEEQPLVDAVQAAMEEIAERMDRQEGRAVSLAEEADLLFNPLPARVSVKLPGELLSAEGFEKAEENQVVVEPVDLVTALTRLEGRWIEPDPLAAMIRERVPSSESLAALPRRSTPVVPGAAIAGAIREQLERPKSYVVRWRD